MARSKRAIPQATRRQVALNSGGVPGETTDARCVYCGAAGHIYWPRLGSGNPGAWVSFSDLELDHVIAESLGGGSEPQNIVLACRTCNRRKGARPLGSD